MIKTSQDMASYKKEIRAKLKNEFLKKTLNNFAVSYRESRANAFKDINFDALRSTIESGKNDSISNIDALYNAFKEKAEARGAKIHFAKTAEEANAIIADIAQANDVQSVVKSKSMTAEETHLNDYLEAKGYKVVETDLGEWIIQLRHEGPSHMVMPAIHLSRSEVAELFTDVTGKKQEPDDIKGMVRVARKELRKEFISADMGVSGANFALADSGTIGLVTNEGNARLVTTLPKVHVALVGIDKLVPDLKAALTVLKALPKNATGQAISSYVTWITGANESFASETGNKEFHIVFLDNGRKALAKDPVFSEVLRCIRCGACANVCPIYRKIGGHSYGHVYIGAIGLILTLFYHGKENARAIVRNCLNCQACKAVCPAGIDLPYLIKKTNQRVFEAEGKRPVKNILFTEVLKNRKLFHALLRSAFLAQKPLADKDNVIRHLPMYFQDPHGFRSLPVVAAKPFRERFKRYRSPVNRPTLKVAFFGGCAMDFIYPEQGEAYLKLMESYNVSVDYPMEQSCCGLPALMMADEKTAVMVAKQNLAAVDHNAYDYIVTLCASCASHLKEHYPKLLGNGSAISDDLKRFIEKVMDFSSFMTDVLKVDASDFDKKGRKIVYHAPCHLCRGMHVTEAPRALMKTAGFDYIPTEEEDVCCGFAGSYSVDFAEISKEILYQKLDRLKDTGAELLVTDCPGCVLQLGGGMDKRGIDIDVKHIAQAVLEEKK